jgi:hypothetical protein
VPTPSQAASRWSAFLDKIEGRFHELVGSSEQALPELVDLSGFELTPFMNALTAVRVQCMELIHKVETTWHGQVEAAFEAELGEGAGPRARIEAERERGEALAFKLEQELRQAEVQIAALAAERIVAQARKTLGADFKCSHCSAPLAVKEQFFRSYYVTCQFCQTVNTFEPGTVARQVEHFSVHALAERAALPENLQFLQAEHRYRCSRGAASTAAREKLVEVYGVYIDKYLSERIRWLPDLEKTRQKDRRARMDGFINSIV